MKRQFILDKEISLSNENDYLKTGIYAENLTKIIRNTPPNEVFTVGLFGNWGTGKSSIIETSKRELKVRMPKSSLLLTMRGNMQVIHFVECFYRRFK